MALQENQRGMVATVEVALRRGKMTVKILTQVSLDAPQIKIMMSAAREEEEEEEGGT